MTTIDYDAIYAALAEWEPTNQPTGEQIAVIVTAHDATRGDTLLVTGNPADGFCCIGPVHPGDPGMLRYAEDHGGDWWLLPLTPLGRATGDAASAPDPTPRTDRYRLSAPDETRVTKAITAELANWSLGRPERRSTVTRQDVVALVRIGAHAIGCSAADLRDSELAWIDRQAHRLAGRVEYLDAPSCDGGRRA